MYDTILVPTDGSDHATRAAEYANRLAGWFDATVHVLAVVDARTAAGPFSAGGLTEAERDRFREQGMDRLEDVEAVLTDAADVQTEVTMGVPSDSICEFAADHAVDLIAMGTHGRTGVHRYVTGSVTERVVRLAEAPVLTARANDRSQPDSVDEILVPTDGSEYAAVAIEPGLVIAERAGARVHAVNVFDVATDPTAIDVEPPAATVDALREAGQSAVAEVTDRASARGLEATSEVRRGRPARELLAYADEQDVDLLGMGTHGRTGMSRYLLGSTTERIIRHAEVPVLAVSSPDAAGNDE